MGCGCAGVERAALTIAAAGGGAKIVGPHGEGAVYCAGAALTLQGLAVECRGGGQNRGDLLGLGADAARHRA